jgi:hypothetical protein
LIPVRLLTLYDALNQDLCIGQARIEVIGVFFSDQIQDCLMM